MLLESFPCLSLEEAVERLRSDLTSHDDRKATEASLCIRSFERAVRLAESTHTRLAFAYGGQTFYMNASATMVEQLTALIAVVNQCVPSAPHTPSTGAHER